MVFKQLTQTGKMRSYSQDNYNAYHLTGDELQLISNEYKPSEEFLDSLLSTPDAVPRSHPYIATKIFKTAEYKRHYNSRWQYSDAFPGCTAENGRLLRECSLTQFTFETFKQFQSWEREANRLRDKTGQTYESWFINDDGSLDFEQMVGELDTMIRSGKMRFSQSRKKAKYENLAREYQDHPDAITLQKIKGEKPIAWE